MQLRFALIGDQNVQNILTIEKILAGMNKSLLPELREVKFELSSGEPSLIHELGVGLREVFPPLDYAVGFRPPEHQTVQHHTRWHRASNGNAGRKVGRRLLRLRSWHGIPAMQRARAEVARASNCTA